MCILFKMDKMKKYAHFSNSKIKKKTMSVNGESTETDIKNNDSTKNVHTKRILLDKKYAQKNRVFYVCETCDYKTSRKSDFQRHNDSNKCSNEDSFKKYAQKNDGYICECCNYETKILYNFRKHLKTNKHHKNEIKKKLKKVENTVCQEKEIIRDVKNNTNDIVDVLVKQNQALQDKLIEMASQPKIIVNNHTQNTQNNNQKTNIIQFLNNNCKDAVNLSDFVKQLVVTFDDLETIENKGYVTSIKDTLIKSLGDMETEKRPIHCTDVKRKQFYVKDNNIWEKEKDSHSKLCNALNDYNNKQLITMQNWKEENPGWSVIDQKQDKVNRLTKEVASLSSIQNKLIHEIGEMTKICLKSNKSE